MLCMPSVAWWHAISAGYRRRIRPIIRRWRTLAARRGACIDRAAPLGPQSRRPHVRIHPDSRDHSGAEKRSRGDARRSAIDAAHVLGSGPAASSDETAPVAAENPPREESGPSAPALELLSQMRTQGRQLAQLLHQRQQDLDRREAQQHAHAAELDNQRRAAQVWLSARHHELAEREQQISAREREAADATSRLSAAESYLDAARREFETDLKRRENELVRDRQELERKRQAPGMSGHRPAGRAA